MTKGHFYGIIVLKTAMSRGNFERKFQKFLKLLKYVKRKSTYHIKLHLIKIAMSEV